MIPLPSADTDTPEAGAGAAADEGRGALLEALTTELGDALLDSHLLPGKDLWIRISTEAWAGTADYLRHRQRFRFFDFLSAIDWMPSPYGRSLDAAVDNILEGKGLVGDGDDGDEASADESNAGAAPSGAGCAGSVNEDFAMLWSALALGLSGVRFIAAATSGGPFGWSSSSSSSNRFKNLALAIWRSMDSGIGSEIE